MTIDSKTPGANIVWYMRVLLVFECLWIVKNKDVTDRNSPRNPARYHTINTAI